MNAEISTILFDLDGTLLDTLADLQQAVNHALSCYGYLGKGLEEVRRSVGNGVAKLIERVLPEGRENPCFEDCLEKFREYYSDHMQDLTQPYPDIPELLVELREHGYRLGIVSNKFDAAVKELGHNYFEDIIEVAIGESPEVRKKPAPDCVFEAIRILGSHKESVIFVGDSDVDVETAHNAGLPCVGVTWGFRDRNTLKDAGADYIIEKPMELLTLLEEWSKE